MRRALFIVATLAAALALPLRALAQTPIHWVVARSDAKPLAAGATFNVSLTVQIDAGWHLYSLAQQPPPQATSIRIKGDKVFSAGGSIDAPTPSHAYDQNFDMDTEFYETRATFTVPVTIAKGAPNGRATVHILVNYQTCNDHLCLPPTDEDVPLDVAIGTTGSAPAGAGSAASGLASASSSANPPAGTSSAAPSVPPAGTSPNPSNNAPAPASTTTRRVVPDLAAASATASTLPAFIGLAALMGALSLLTPCVFPMVPITVSYFTSRGGRSRRESVALALVYGVGIVLTFTALGFTLAIGFGASGLNRFAADPWLNLGVTALFVAFALSLFGVFEIALPSRFVNAAATADRGRGRLAGTLLMGLAFTLTSFTCTAPFLGTLLVLASQGQWQWPLAGMLAFSSVFALPFVILALAPQWISSLPKSGGWLLAVKVVMGLLELAAAMKFLSNVDLVWGWGIFTRTTVLVTWVAIAAVLVAYLLGWLKLGHSKLARPGVARGILGAAAIALGVWLGTGLSGRGLGELEAFLPPADLTGAQGGELTWIMNDYDAALSQAAREHRPIFVDFTGYTCTNCRWMEANMFPKPDVSRALARYVRVRLYTDGQGEIYRRYQQMQRDTFGTVALPYYAALSSSGEPTVAFGGLTRNPSEFIAFLQRGLQ